jgi:hypothetical protein
MTVESLIEKLEEFKYGDPVSPEADAHNNAIDYTINCIRQHEAESNPTGAERPTDYQAFVKELESASCIRVVGNELHSNDQTAYPYTKGFPAVYKAKAIAGEANANTLAALDAATKYAIADNITIEGRSKADVVQDVWDEIMERVTKRDSVAEYVQCVGCGPRYPDLQARVYFKTSDSKTVITKVDLME